MRRRLEVLWRLDGTTKTDRFDADHVSVTRFDGGRVQVDLVNGHDDAGPVQFASYERAYRVLDRGVTQEPTE